jgi:hypothetical protein
MNFRHIDTALTRLWDYGWFDASRFAVSGTNGESHDGILSGFTKSPVFARSFCESPDPWGKQIDRHGPFLLAQFQSEWYTPIPIEQLQPVLRDAIRSHDFQPDLDTEQWAVVDQWAKPNDASIAWRLDAPEDDFIRVEFASIWWAFDQFVIYNADTCELSIAVVGFD